MRVNDMFCLKLKVCHFDYTAVVDSWKVALVNRFNNHQFGGCSYSH